MSLGRILITMLAAGVTSFGGGQGLIAVAHHEWVETGLLTPAMFAWAVALGQVTPGPTSVLVAVLGFQLAGVGGAMVAVLGASLPTWILACVAGNSWEALSTRFRRLGQATTWVVIALFLQVAIRLVPSLGMSWWEWVIMAAALGLVAWTRVDPVWIILSAAVLGWIVG